MPEGGKMFRYWVLGLSLLLFLAYSNHFENEFHFDDEHTIVNNAAIRDLKNIPRFFTDATTTSSLPPNQAYRPGLTTLNTIDYAIQENMKRKAMADSGSFAAKFEQLVSPEYAARPALLKEKTINPFYFHLSVFLSFCLLGVLLYYFFLNIFQLTLPKAPVRYAALAGTAFFLLHTANAETINYIIARSDSFSTLLIIACFVLYQYWEPARKYHLYLIFFCAGFFVKEPVLMFSPLLFLFDWLIIRKQALSKNITPLKIWNSLRPALPSLAVGAGLFYLANKLTPPTWDSGGYNTWAYLFTQPFVMAHYFRNFLIPTALSADTDWTLVSGPGDYRIYAGILFVVSLIIIAFRFSKHPAGSPIAFGILWFFVALLPTSSIFPLAEVLNDHRVFFPYIGLVLAFTWLGVLIYEKYKSRFSGSHRLKLISGSLLIIFFLAHAWGVYSRNKVWKTGESLWKDVTEKSPENGRGLMNYGNALMAKGDFPGAWNYYQKALKLLPQYSYLYINMGILKGALGETSEAEYYFKAALDYGKSNPEGNFYYARFLHNNGRYREAITICREGLQKSPGHLNLQLMLEECEKALQAQVDTGLQNALEEVRKNPGADSYLNLSLYYYLAGSFEKCIEAAEMSLKFKPDYDLAYNNICSAYNELGQYEKAIEAGEKAIALNPQNELAKNNLAEAKRRLAQKK
jgi:protein O-mannosyl-transferase